MNFKNAGFRALYKRLCAFALDTPYAKDAIEGFPSADHADCVLTWGYCDQDRGLTLEILAAGVRTEDGFRFFDGSEEISSKLRIEVVESTEFWPVDDPDGTLQARFADKISMVESYNASEVIEKIRAMAFLDECRDLYCIDDVRVLLIRERLQTEECWVRITDLEDSAFYGILLNEPYQDFGCHEGDEISFRVMKMQNQRIVCFADLNPKEE